jgi:hypothetical protein
MERGTSPIELTFPNLGNNVEAIVEQKWPKYCHSCDRYFGSKPTPQLIPNTALFVHCDLNSTIIGLLLYEF